MTAVTSRTLHRREAEVSYLIRITCCSLTFLFITEAALADRQDSSSKTLPPLEWNDQISPGISQEQLTSLLNSLGIDTFAAPRGLTYTSKIVTDRRDYLFCNDALYAILEGGFFSGHDFNIWFDTFLHAHDLYGAPTQYETNQEWSQFRALWELPDNDVIYFILRTDKRSRQGWTRQLYNVPSGKACGGVPGLMR